MKSRNDKKIELNSSYPNALSLSERAIKGILWTGSRTVIIYAVRTFTLMALARLLSPEDFGIMAAAAVIVGFSSALQHLGIGQALVQRSALESAHIRAGLTLSLLFGGVLTLTIWVVAPIVAQFFPFENMVIVLRALASTFFLTGLSVVARALLQREMRFRALAGLEALSYAVGYVGVAIPLAVFGFKVWALVGAYLAEVFVSSVGALLLQPHDFRPLVNWCAIKQLLNFGGGYTITSIANYASMQADKILVGRLLGPHLLGIYSRAYYFIATASTLVESTVGRVLFPIMTQLQRDHKQLTSAYLRSISLINVILCPIVMVSAAFAPELIDVVLGKQWGETVIPFQLLAPGMWFGALYEISLCLIKAKGAVYPLGVIQILYFSLIVLGAWLGQRWGVAGVAGGVMTAMAMNALLVIVLSLKLIKTTWHSTCSIFVPAVVSGSVLGLWSWIISKMLRFFNFPSIVTLLIVGLSCVLMWSLFWRLNPNFFFGASGTEAMRMLVAKVPLQIQPAVYLLFGRKNFSNNHQPTSGEG